MARVDSGSIERGGCRLRIGPAVIRVAVVAVAVAAVGIGCRNKPTHRRTGDAAPVEILTSPVVPDGGGQASEEIEPNDADDVATVLALGGTVRGTSDPEGEVDRYRIAVTASGALSVMVDPHEALDAVLEIEDGSGTLIARSDRGGVRIREGVPNLAVTPGRYTAVVKRSLPPAPSASSRRKPPKRPAPEPAKPQGGPYEISAATAAPAPGSEHEPDDDRGQANDLIAGDTASGSIGWSGDTDVWKVSVEALSAKNALEFELSAVEGIALTLEISDGVGHGIISRKGPRGGPLVVRGFVPVVPPGAPPFHYLTVKADRSNPETAYQLRVTPKLIAPDAEAEPNDTPDTAMPVPADRKSLHAHWSAGDVDCFAIAPEETARALDVSIDTPSGLDLAIDVLIDGKLAAKVDHPGKGAAEKLLVSVPAGAHAVIRVRGSDAAGDGPYELVINEGAALP